MAKMLAIGDGHPESNAAPPLQDDGQPYGRGLIPRDYKSFPVGHYACAKPFDLPLIPQSEWADRLAAQKAQGAQLTDIRNAGNAGSPIPSRDQDGKGYCLPAGTMIRMAEGPEMPIERVCVDDWVVSAEGRRRQVRETYVRRFSGELFNPCLAEGLPRPLWLTGNHAVLSSWNLLSGDEHVSTSPGYIPVEMLLDRPIKVKDVCVAQFAPLQLRSRWAKVIGVEKRRFDGLVYNFAVDKDQSYVAEGIGVHNCWAHSSVSAALIVRAVNGEPYADLSAYAVACIIKGYRDQGGWGAESLEWIAENGVPTSATWPQQSMSRANDNPAMRADAAQHKFTQWMDLEPRNKEQLVTCLLLDIPVVVDYDWWSHSICALNLESLSPFTIRIWNSWGDGWSDNGTGLLVGEAKALPDSQIAPRVMTASQT